MKNGFYVLLLCLPVCILPPSIVICQIKGKDDIFLFLWENPNHFVLSWLKKWKSSHYVFIPMCKEIQVKFCQVSSPNISVSRRSEIPNWFGKILCASSVCSQACAPTSEDVCANSYSLTTTVTFKKKGVNNVLSN